MKINQINQDIKKTRKKFPRNRRTGSEKKKEIEPKKQNDSSFSEEKGVKIKLRKFKHRKKRKCRKLFFEKFDKSNKYYSGNINIKCDFCSNYIFFGDELCFFDSSEHMACYFIHLLSTSGSLVYCSQKPLDLLIQELKNFLKKEEELEDRKRNVCKICLVKIINSESPIELIKNLFASKFAKPHKRTKMFVVEKVEPKAPLLFEETLYISLQEAKKQMSLSFQRLLNLIHQLKTPKNKEMLCAVKEDIEKEYKEIKNILTEINQVFKDINIRILLINFVANITGDLGIKTQINDCAYESIQSTKDLKKSMFCYDLCSNMHLASISNSVLFPKS